ncbi:MAG: hypothetical protein RR728_09890, partial [Oscillospiraceae bacterium]
MDKKVGLMKKNNSLTYLKNQLKGSGIYLVIAVVFILIGAFFEFLGPKLIGVTVDSVIGDKPMDMPRAIVEYVNALGGREFLRENLLMLIGVFALVAATSGLCELARLYAGHNLSENLGYN